MKLIIRVLRAVVVSGALVSCWLVGGAAHRAPDQSDANVAERLDVSRYTTQDLVIDAANPAQQITTQLVLGGRERRLIMQPHSLRSSEFVLFEPQADGSLRSIEPPPPRTYRGSIEGEPGSVVAASLNEDGSLSGAVEVDGEVWGFQPLREADANAPAARHVVYRQKDLVVPPGVCGVIDPPNPIDAPGDDAGEGGIAGSGMSGGVQADIAFDADFEYFVLNGSSIPNTMADIENLMNVVEAMYLREVGIVFRITGIVVRTTEPDPYTTTNPGALLNQFGNHWNSTQPIVRDLAELMTGKDLDGGIIGIATQGTVCVSFSQAYNLVQSKFSFNLLHRAHLSGHEIGHNFNAPHCDGQTDCGLMCSVMGNCGGNILGFGANTGPTIISWRNSLPCLSALTPVSACCVGSTCTQVSAAECAAAGGTWFANTPCTARTTYSATPNLAIPNINLAGITNTITVPDSYLLSDLNVRLNIPHTWIGDLIVDLQHNGGPFVRIVDRLGVPFTAFGCDANNLNVWLDDEAPGTLSIENVCSPFFPFQASPGSAPSSGPAFVPNALLAFFNGQNAQGTWTLRVIDAAQPDTGVLASWTLDIEHANSNLCAPQGACCVGATCTSTNQAACTAMSGTWTAGQACFQSSTSTTNPGVAIPDGNLAGVLHTLNVGTGFSIHDLNLKLVINHTRVGDLVVKLSHNGGPSVTVIDQPGVPASPFGCQSDNYNIVLDDEGIGGPIENVCGVGVNPTSPPNYTPANPLSFFDGQNANGSWTLNVIDVLGSDAGTLVSWSLIAEDDDTDFCAVSDCPPDIAPPGGNSAVDVDDLLAVISAWGPCPAPPAQCAANIVTTGGSATDVDVDDLLAVIGAWGPCP